jgi:glutamyl-tRNA reductase
LSVVVVGVEHQQAPLELLERVIFGDADLAKMLGTLRAWENVQEAVVLSTCLRTEVYAVVDRFHDAVDDLCELLAGRAGLDDDRFGTHTSVRFDDDVAAHLFAVAAGLESAVVGETEVLGQVRRAWERARAERTCGPVLEDLFRGAVRAGKRARAETGVARGTTSFSFAAIEIAGERRSGGLADAAVAVVGAGAMGSGIVRALGRLPEGRRSASVVVVNRSRDRARRLVEAAAPELGARAVGIEELQSVLAESDVVFTAVESAGPVLSASALSSASSRPGGVLVVDLGMPRNVDPQAAALEGVTLLDMDDLRVAVGEAVDERRAEAERAGAIVADELARYRAASRARGAAPMVSALRSRLEALRVRELERHRGRLSGLGPGALEEVDAVTKAILAKVLHEPTVVLRETSGTPKGERLVEALRTLFDL